MSEFTPITTQEEFDLAIKDRINRVNAKNTDLKAELDAIKGEKEECDKKIAEMVAKNDEMSKQIKDFGKQIAEKDTAISGYVTNELKSRIAHEMGLDFDAIKFLQGTDEESIKESAESLKGLVGKHSAPPMASGEGSAGKDTKTAAYKEMLGGLFN